eukprot:gene15163-16722_t
MASSLYLEHYLDSIENLPYELQRNFTLLRDLDQRAHDLLTEIDKICDDYVTNIRGLTPPEKRDYLEKIDTAFKKSREYGDDKVQLAIQTYEMVDRHIRKLDSDLTRFENELKQQRQLQVEEPEVPAKKEKGKKRKSEKVESGKKKRKSKNVLEEAPLPVSATPLITMATDMNVLDMPVDPNEPTYCLCHQVSYGEMIGCDNLDCPIEWFHFGCVGLSSKPKGKWFCPKCSQDKKKK